MPLRFFPFSPRNFAKCGKTHTYTQPKTPQALQMMFPGCVTSPFESPLPLEARDPALMLLNSLIRRHRESPSSHEDLLV